MEQQHREQQQQQPSSLVQLLHPADAHQLLHADDQMHLVPPPVLPSSPAPGTDDWIKNRRESHKEVERRRREVINNGINELAKIVPSCTDRNKGGILHRSVQYIAQLKEAEQRNAERWTLDKMLADQAITDLTAYVEFLKAENETLRTQITQLGGDAPPRAQGPPQPNFNHGHQPLLHHAAAMAGHFPGYFHPQMWTQMGQMGQMTHMPSNAMTMFQTAAGVNGGFDGGQSSVGDEMISKEEEIDPDDELQQDELAEGEQGDDDELLLQEQQQQQQSDQEELTNNGNNHTSIGNNEETQGDSDEGRKRSYGNPQSYVTVESFSNLPSGQIISLETEKSVTSSKRPKRARKSKMVMEDA